MALMNIGLIGLGRMGLGIGQRLVNDGHHVAGFDFSAQALARATALGITAYGELEDLARTTSTFWIMVPAGAPVDKVITTLQPHLKPGAIIIDGGNSHFSDALRRSAQLKENNIAYLDCGTSGGLHGAQTGYCLMVGGDKQAFDYIEPILKSIAAPNGYGHVGPTGAGHYVKMVHNGIEYALLQSYAEGFQLLKHGHYPELDLATLSNLWQHGSIIRSWILQLATNVLERDQSFGHISGRIGENKTGQWTIDEAHKQNVSTPMLEKALEMRAWSRESGGDYATKMVALLRHEFGGHPLVKKDGYEKKD